MIITSLANILPKYLCNEILKEENLYGGKFEIFVKSFQKRALSEVPE